MNTLKIILLGIMIFVCSSSITAQVNKPTQINTFQKYGETIYMATETGIYSFDNEDITKISNPEEWVCVAFEGKPIGYFAICEGNFLAVSKDCKILMSSNEEDRVVKDIFYTYKTEETWDPSKDPEYSEEEYEEIFFNFEWLAQSYGKPQSITTVCNLRLWHTEDFGKTWRPLATAGTEYMSQVYASPLQDDLVMALGYNGYDMDFVEAYKISGDGELESKGIHILHTFPEIELGAKSRSYFSYSQSERMFSFSEKEMLMTEDYWSGDVKKVYSFQDNPSIDKNEQFCNIMAGGVREVSDRIYLYHSCNGNAILLVSGDDGTTWKELFNPVEESDDMIHDLFVLLVR